MPRANSPANLGHERHGFLFDTITVEHTARVAVDCRSLECQ